MTTLADVLIESTYANLPAAGEPGRTAYTTDTLQIYYDNGASWDNVTPALRASAINAIQQQIYLYAADTGAANAYAVALTPAPTLVAGSVVFFKAVNANTGASTLAVNGGPAIAIRKQGSVALTGGEIAAGQIVTVVYDGTDFQMLGGAVGGGGGSTSTAVDSIASLRGLNVPSGQASVVVEGYSASGDGGGGTFVWDAASSAADDSGTVILPTGYAGAGRWRRLYSGEVFVRWFGAKGDGATNDSAAIQAAITAAAATWGKVSFDAATYACTGLSLTNDKVVLIGQSGTVLLNNSGSSEILIIHSDRCTVEMIEFNGNQAVIGSNRANLLVLGSYNSIVRCRSYNSANQGICLDGQGSVCSNNLVTGCEVHNNNAMGVSQNKVSDSVISNNFIYANGFEGITMDNVSSRSLAIGNRIDGNCQLGGVGGIGVDFSDDCRIIGNCITNTGGGLPGVMVKNNLGQTNRMIVSGNSITGNGAAGGVWLHNGIAGITNACVVSGNDISGNGALSVVVDAGCTNNMIVGNNLNGVAVTDNGTGTTIIQSSGGGGGGSYTAGSGLTLTGTQFSLATPIASTALPKATVSALGAVKPDGSTITIDASGMISSLGGGSGVPLAISASPDWPPASPSAYDDEFTGGALDPKWTANVPASSGAPSVIGTLLSIATTPINSDHFTTVLQTAPAVPYTATAKVAMTGPNQNFYYGGICLGDGSGKLIFLYLQNGGSVIWSHWNSNTSFNAVTGTLAVDNGGMQYLRVIDNGTNLIALASRDGQNFATVLSESRTAFLAAGPTLVGLAGGNNTVAGTATLFSCDWFRVTTP
jgi:hypothetical protein